MEKTKRKQTIKRMNTNRNEKEEQICRPNNISK